MKINDIINNFTVLDIYYNKKQHRKYVSIICNKCNKIKNVRFSDVEKYSNQCLCNNIKYIHDEHHKRLYRIYHHIKDRCYNSNNDAYKNYGFKGVRMCEDWLSDFIVFKQWALNNGYDKTLTIDRINSNGDYCPENCRWITKSENVARSNISNPRKNKK